MNLPAWGWLISAPHPRQANGVDDSDNEGGVGGLQARRRLVLPEAQRGAAGQGGRGRLFALASPGPGKLSLRPAAPSGLRSARAAALTFPARPTDCARRSCKAAWATVAAMVTSVTTRTYA